MHRCYVQRRHILENVMGERESCVQKKHVFLTVKKILSSWYFAHLWIYLIKCLLSCAFHPHLSQLQRIKNVMWCDLTAWMINPTSPVVTKLELFEIPLYILMWLGKLLSHFPSFYSGKIGENDIQIRCHSTALPGTRTSLHRAIVSDGFSWPGPVDDISSANTGSWELRIQKLGVWYYIFIYVCVCFWRTQQKDRCRWFGIFLLNYRSSWKVHCSHQCAINFGSSFVRLKLKILWNVGTPWHQSAVSCFRYACSLPAL